jgi:hypothetical protein
MEYFVMGCFGVSLSLALFEFFGILKARLKNITKSTKRVVVRGLIFFSLVFLFGKYLEWQYYIATFSYKNLENARLSNTPFVICCVVIALVLILILFELMSLRAAREKGLTKNISRFVTALVILACVFPILKGTLVMWDKYVQALQGDYQDPTLLQDPMTMP